MLLLVGPSAAGLRAMPPRDRTACKGRMAVRPCSSSSRPDTPTAVEVAIVGGGLGGLALAAGLRRRGVDAHVYEAAPQLRTSTATIIGLGPNTLVALESLHPELPNCIRSNGVPVETCLFVNNARPGLQPGVRRQPRADGAQQLTVIQWAKVQTSFSELLPPNTIHCSHPVTGYTELPQEGLTEGSAPAAAGGGSAGCALVHFRGQPDVRARLVVGADGINSAIRAAMHPGESGPRYHGEINWSSLVPTPHPSVLNAHEPAEVQSWSDQGIGEVPNTLMLVADAGCGVSAWAVSMNFPTKAHTNGVRGGPGIPGSKARVLERLRQLGWDKAAALVEMTDEADIYERAIQDRLPLERWSSPGRRVVLLGDAAHAMHPGPGQGARMAFEDADQLALALEAHGLGNVPAAVQQYEHRRIFRANRVQAFSTELSGFQELRDASRPAGLSPQQMLQRWAEFRTWTEGYPAHLLGDPSSTYWRPLEHGPAAQQAPSQARMARAQA